MRSLSVLLVLILQISLWRADAFFALAGIVRVQSACSQSNIWNPAPALVQNLCLQCFCVNAAFALSICSVIPNLFVVAGACVPFIVNATTTTTLAPPTVATTAGFTAPAVLPAAGTGAILPAAPGLAIAGPILPAAPASAVNQFVQGFPGLNYLPGSVNTIGGVPATLSPGSGVAGVGFVSPNTNFNTLAGTFPSLFGRRRK